MKKLLLILIMACFASANAQFWTTKATGFATTSRGLNSISIASPTVIWAKAYDGASTAATPPSVREYTKSIDGGDTWVSGSINLGINNTNLNVSSITAVSDQIAWVSAFKSTGSVQGIYKTVNGGTTWARQATASFNTGTDSFPNFVYFWDANNGICQGDPASGYFEIYTTTNGGQSWTRVPQSNIPDPIVVGTTGEYGYVNNYDVYGDTIWFGTSRGRIFRSSNKGLNWTVSTSPIDDFGGDPTAGGVNGSYSFSDASNGLLVSSFGLLYNTVDGGTTWNVLSANGNFYSNDIKCVQNSSKVISAGAGSSYSLDNGLNWIDIDAVQHLTLAFLDENIGFSGGFTTSPTVGGISKYTGTELMVKNFTPFKFVISPNPAVDNVKITNTENILISNITVNDVNGKIIKELKLNNSDNVDINVTDLNTGIYFINITSDAGKVVKKFIKN